MSCQHVDAVLSLPAHAWGVRVHLNGGRADARDVSVRFCGLVSAFGVLGPVCADSEPLGHPLGALGSFPAKYCSLARLNG